MRSVGQFFRPELINRLDELLIFNKLPPSVILDIVTLRLSELRTRLAPRRIKLEVEEDALAWLATKGYSEQFGARAVARVVRDKIVTKVASRLLEGEIKYVFLPINDESWRDRDGDVVNIAVRGDELNISSRPDPANQDLTADGGKEEPRTLEVLEDVEDDVEEERTRAHFW
jgi:ATP-dependent Clp protease ATP-binding subunit ClpB